MWMIFYVILLVSGNECPYNREVTQSKNKEYPRITMKYIKYFIWPDWII